MSVDEAIIPIKINELVSLIAERKHLSHTDALGYLYNSHFYNKLTNPATKYWYMSGLYLYKELEKEKTKIVLTENDLSKEKMFLVFCTEKYIKNHSLTASEVYTLFQKYKVFDFLTTNYEALHTQSEQYILEEIDLYLKKRLSK